jgi:hypothetical protein
LRHLLLSIVFICGCRFYSLSLFVAAAFIRFLYLWLPLFFTTFICSLLSYCILQN